jgi:predicted nucleic-acid-binding protein
MKAVDTNVIVRFLIRDDEAQAFKARDLFEEAERRREPLWIGVGVLLECLWVLDAVYGCSRDEIINALSQLRLLSALEFESADAVDELISGATANKAELDDLLLGVLARRRGCEATLTFDKQAARSPYFSLIE